MTRRAVIIGANRTGGTFLAACLSNHTDIHCPRGEIFSKEAPWQQQLELGHAALLDFVLAEPFYTVAMCRLTYVQAFNREVRDYLIGRRVKVVHLVRDDAAVVTSALLAKQEKAAGTPRHVFADEAVQGFVDDEILDVGPEEVAARLEHLRKQRARFEHLYTSAPVLVIRYEAMTAPNPVVVPAAVLQGCQLNHQVGHQLAEFLGVRFEALQARNVKMHRRPLASYYRRWAEIRGVFGQ